MQLESEQRSRLDRDGYLFFPRLFKADEIAVLLDKTSKRRMALEPDYFGFRTASKEMWVGYGLASPNGTERKPGVYGPNPRRAVSSSEKLMIVVVRPWKLLCATTILPWSAGTPLTS